MSADPTPLARFHGVTKRYGDHVALNALDLEVVPGEVFGLLGPNGAGKTTALRILCGLLAPDAGTIEVGGHDVQRDPLAARRALGFVPDGAPLYPGLSIQAHLTLVGRLREMDETELEESSVALLEALDLSDRREQLVGELSRGLRQKAALACALIARPPLLVLDEPLTGLDAPTAATIKEVLRGWSEDTGCGVLYTSHVLEVVERVCDRMAVLHRGELRAMGDLEELRRAAGKDGSLEEVFSSLAFDDDPRERARRILAAVPRRS